MLARQPYVVLGVVGWAYRLHSLVAAPEEAAPSAFRLLTSAQARAVASRLCQRACRVEEHQQVVRSAVHLVSARSGASALAEPPVVHCEVHHRVALGPQTNHSTSPDDAELAQVHRAQALWGPRQRAVAAQARTLARWQVRPAAR